MLKANNQVLFQDTNQNIVSIRQAEIQYYISVYQSFATQAALIGGFTYGVLQNSSRGPDWQLDLDSFYALFAAATILAAVHIILCCLFLQVYGPGLSLYGKPGSMAKAAEVLRGEQPMIVRSFMLMILFFVASTTCLFWSVLDYLAAILCSVALVLAVRYWWYFSHRIYASLAWEGEHGLSDFVSNDENPIDKLKASSNQGAVEDIEMGSSSVKSALHHRSSAPTSSSKISSSNPPPSCLMEGYLTRKNLGVNGKWERRYVVLAVNGLLLVYKDRKEYRETGKSSLNEKALPLEDYVVTFDFSNGSYALEIKELLLSSEKKFLFLMVEKGEEAWRSDSGNKNSGNGKRFVFSCDIEEELLLWRTAISNY